MTDKKVTSSGAGSVAIGGSAKGSKIAPNVAIVGRTSPSPTDANVGGVHASGPGAVAIGESADGADIRSTVNISGGGDGKESDEETISFPSLSTPVDLILRISRDTGDRFRFDALSNDGEQVGPFFEEISNRADFSTKLSKIQRRLLDGDIVSELAGYGAEIAKRLPRALLEGAQPLLRVALDMKRAPSILILTNEPYIPWELALIEVNGKRAYLGELAKIGRWPIDPDCPTPPDHLELGSFQAIAATSYFGAGKHLDLPEALKERQFLVETFSATPHEGVRADLQAWLNAPQSSSEAVHIALHGFSDPNANEQRLILGDGHNLTPNELLALRPGDTPVRRYSLVFVNACQSGSAGDSLGQVGGFPGVLARNGAGAIIAPLWEVKDSEARAFAESFYKKTLEDEMPVGLALRNLRQAQGDTHSVTRLAYIFYGHPLLTLNRS